jgi:hypothetical protein
MRVLSISKAWEETKAVIAADGRLMYPVALALIGLPVAVGAFAGPNFTVDKPMQPGLWLIGSLVVFLILLAGLIALAALAMRKGIRVSDAVIMGFRRLLPVCGVTFGVVLAVSVCGAIVVAAIGTAASPLMAAQVLVLLFLLLSPLLSRLALVPSTAASEEGGPVQLVRRSWEITRGSSLRLWGLMILFSVTVTLVELAVGLTVGSVLMLWVGDISEPWSLSRLIISVVFGLLRAVELLVISVMLARIYVQLVGRGATSVPSSGA